MNTHTLIGQKFQTAFMDEPLSKDVWPNIFVLTDKAGFLYDGKAFVQTSIPSKVEKVAGIETATGKIIVDAVDDGELTVLILEDGSVVFFEISHNPFAGEVKSWPSVGVQNSDEVTSWLPEFSRCNKMNPRANQ